MIFMTHHEHGANNVSESEVAEQEKHGWKVTSRSEWMAQKVSSQDIQQDIAKPAEQNSARRGRPPKAR